MTWPSPTPVLVWPFTALGRTAIQICPQVIINVFWDVMPCSVVAVYGHYRETIPLHFLGKLIYLVHRCSRLLWNMRAHLPDNMASYPRRLRSHSHSRTNYAKVAYSQVNLSFQYHHGLSPIIQLSSQHIVVPGDTCVHTERILINGHNT